MFAADLLLLFVPFRFTISKFSGFGLFFFLLPPLHSTMQSADTEEEIVEDGSVLLSC